MTTSLAQRDPTLDGRRHARNCEGRDQAEVTPVGPQLYLSGLKLSLMTVWTGLAAQQASGPLRRVVPEPDAGSRKTKTICSHKRRSILSREVVQGDDQLM